MLAAEKKLRQDLYYRLNVFPITIPPLRARASHLSSIADYLAHAIAKRLGKPIRPFSQTAYAELARYEWPGNIRELENVIERSIIISRGDELMLPPLGEDTQNMSNVSFDVPFGTDMKSIERAAIVNALKQSGGNRRKASEILGISLRSLQYKIKEYNLD
jgi:transcriptional regulator with PAS, ATPase and Fis domain